jgi:hypothetical protein
LESDWTLISEGPSGAQLKSTKRKLKIQTKVGFVLGILLLAAFGIGLLLLIFAFVDQSNTPYPTYFLSRENPAMPPPLKAPKESMIVVGFLVFLSLLFGWIIISAMLR